MNENYETWTIEDQREAVRLKRIIDRGLSWFEWNVVSKDNGKTWERKL